jgi:general secretion pathway protein E
MSKATINEVTLATETPDFLARVLTLPGAEFHIDAETRLLLAYFSDGKLLISKSHEFDPRVQAFVGRIKRLNRPYRPQHVELSMVAAAYASGQLVPVSISTPSEMQDLAQRYFLEGSRKKSSDIHIRVSIKGTTQIFMRENGSLELVDEQTGEVGRALCATIYQALADIADATYDINSPQDGRINGKHKLPQSLVAIRISTAPTTEGTSMVLRLLYNDPAQSSDLTILGYHASQLNSLKRLKDKPYGVIIISGPTGSGKSTTLQRVLLGIIREAGGKLHILTVEDPPEYPVAGATQIPVANAPDESSRAKAFHAAIRTALRQDPDILMIGEMRDGPAAMLAIECAMTGHPTYGTLHANSSFDIISRLVFMDVPTNLAYDYSVITGLISQRLLAVLCPECKEPLSKVHDRYDPADVRRIGKTFDGYSNIFVRNPAGCDQCRYRGVSSRTVVAEVVETTPEIMRLLREENKDRAMDHFIATGGLSMNAHACMKVSAGLVDPFSAEKEVGYLGANAEIKDDATGAKPKSRVRFTAT